MNMLVWDGLGVDVRGSSSSEEVLNKAGLNWIVRKEQSFFNGIDGIT